LAGSTSVRGPSLSGGLVDLDAIELAHGETFTPAATAFNIQGAKGAE